MIRHLFAAASLLMLPCPAQADASRLAITDRFAVIAVQQDGSLLTWGNGDASAEGADYRSSHYPRRVNHTDRIKAVTVGDGYTLALRQDGSVAAWGYRNLALGSGNGLFGLPMRIAGLDEVIDIAAGDEHALALRRDGSVWGWGSNALSQLGEKSGPGYHPPRRIQGLPPIKMVSTRSKQNVALAVDGTVWAWGYGYPESFKTPAPVRIGKLERIVSVAENKHGTVALDSDGTLWTWRADSLPQKLAGLPPLRSIRAFQFFHYAIARNGALWRYLPGLSSERPPEQISGIQEIVDIASAGDYSYEVVVVLSASGDVYRWGDTHRDPDDGYRPKLTTPTPMPGVGNDGTLNLNRSNAPAEALPCQGEAVQTNRGVELSIPCVRFQNRDYAVRLETEPALQDGIHFKLIDLR